MSYEVTLTDASFWIDGDDLERFLRAEDTSLEQLLDDEHWDLRIDRDGNVHDIDYKTITCTGDMQLTLDRLAPIVRKGSFIAMEGEDGSIGRYQFDGKKCVAAGPLFENDDDDEDEDD